MVYLGITYYVPLPPIFDYLFLTLLAFIFPPLAVFMKLGSAPNCKNQNPIVCFSRKQVYDGNDDKLIYKRKVNQKGNLITQSGTAQGSSEQDDNIYTLLDNTAIPFNERISIIYDEDNNDNIFTKILRQHITTTYERIHSNNMWQNTCCTCNKHDAKCKDKTASGILKPDEMVDGRLVNEILQDLHHDAIELNLTFAWMTKLDINLMGTGVLIKKANLTSKRT
ncbi:hypothetical protein GJ496_002082 [Pomphorhynchus laevis]|nr:hypothetical protein GJ496_002082 [Pomphorhynchus laevis]